MNSLALRNWELEKNKFWQPGIIQEKKTICASTIGCIVYSSAEKREQDAHHKVCWSCVRICVSMKSVIILMQSVIILRKSVGTVAAGGLSDA